MSESTSDADEASLGIRFFLEPETKRRRTAGDQAYLYVWSVFDDLFGAPCTHRRICSEIR